MNPILPSALPNQVRSYHYQGSHNGSFFRLMRRVTSAVKNCFSPLLRNLFPKGPEFVVYLREESNEEVKIAKELLYHVLKTRVRRRIEIIQWDQIDAVDIAGKRILEVMQTSPTSTEIALQGGLLIRRCWEEDSSRGLLYFHSSQPIYFTPNGESQPFKDHNSFFANKEENDASEASLRHWLGV
jgi:hypothetical protein